MIGVSSFSLLQSLQPDLDLVLTHLIQDIIPLGKNIVLVLEDYHCVKEKQIHSLLEFLINLKYVPRPADVVASNYFAKVDPDLCKGSATCVGRRPTEAVKLDNNVSIIDLARCIGCGVCVPYCPNDAISLVKKEQEIIPPETEEDLYDRILAGKTTNL